MKKLILIPILTLVLTSCDSRKEDYMDRHSKNYDDGNIISRENNPELPGRANVYNAEDFRAGALDVCNKLQEKYKRDLCTEINYWGITGPRI